MGLFDEESDYFDGIFTIVQQQPRVMRRSALRQHDRPPSGTRKAKSVQWVSDIKKRPQDISNNRKIVKSQVQQILFFFGFLEIIFLLKQLFS